MVTDQILQYLVDRVSDKKITGEEREYYQLLLDRVIMIWVNMD
jgi:hypothetical protein